MTYSIVARDPETGDLGVAVQSHCFGTGSVVTWAQAGVGAVATQSIPESSYGPKGLDLMRAGHAADRGPRPARRRRPDGVVSQVAFVDSQGRRAPTPERLVGKAGHSPVTGERAGEHDGRDTVWPAMLAAYEAASDVDLVERLLGRSGGPSRGRRHPRPAVGRVADRVGPASDAPWDQKLYDLGWTTTNVRSWSCGAW